MTFAEVIRHVSTASILVPAVLSLFRLRAIRAAYPTLLVYFWLTALVEAWGAYLIFSGVKNNAPLYHVFHIFELGLLSFLYYRPFNTPFLRRLLFGLNGLYAVLALYHLSTAPFEWNGIGHALQGLTLILLALLFFYRLLHTLEATNLFRFPMFWFNTAILVYFSGTLFVYMFSTYIVTPENYDALRDLWSLTIYLNLVFHLVLSVGVWHTR